MTTCPYCGAVNDKGDGYTLVSMKGKRQKIVDVRNLVSALVRALLENEERRVLRFENVPVLCVVEREDEKEE